MIGTGEVTRRFDTFALILVQAVTIGLGSAVIAAFEGFGEVTAIVVVAVLVTGIACSAIAFSLAAWGQRIVDPERSGVISLLEPVVAGIIGYFAGERLGSRVPRRRADPVVDLRRRTWTHEAAPTGP